MTDSPVRLSYQDIKNIVCLPVARQPNETFENYKMRKRLMDDAYMIYKKGDFFYCSNGVLSKQQHEENIKK